MRRLILPLALLAVGFGCSRDPYEADLASNVGASFEPCNEAEITFLAAKHNVQLVFAPCGANKFSTFAWAPDGLRIFFQLVLSANVMDANSPEKRTIALAIPAPVGPAAWMTSTRLAVPVVAEEDDGPVRLALYDVPTASSDPAVAVTGQVVMKPLAGITQVVDTARGPNGSVWISGRAGDDAPLQLLSVDPDTFALSPAVPHDIGPFSTFSVQAAQSRLVLGHDGTVRVLDLGSGEVVHTFEDATRGNVSPDGRWIALEHPGEAISVFHQRRWGEVSDQARRREEQRAEQFADRLPEHFDRTVQPPTLDLVDLTTLDRWTITSFLGDRFAWYPAADGWASFFLWGFEGKQLKRNVGLMSLKPYLDAIEAGTPRMGLEKVAAAAAPSPTEGDDAPAAEAEPEAPADGE